MRDSHHHGNQTKTYRQALPKEIQNTTAGSAKTRAAAKAAKSNTTPTHEPLTTTGSGQIIANQSEQTFDIANENQTPNIGQQWRKIKPQTSANNGLKIKPQISANNA
jgi:hypothetical protein